jgi:hypothetical protein
MPSGIVVGELLLVFCAGDTSGTMSESGGTSWTILDQGANGTAVQGAIFAKIAAGSDTLSVTFEANDFAAVAVRIQNHGVSNVSTDITKGTAATGSNATPNPPACSPSTAKDYLWLEFFAADDDDASTDYETSGWTKVGQAQSAESSSSCMCAVASYELNDNTINPDVMSMSAWEEWWAQTLAIPPAAIIKATVGPNGAGTGADDSAVGTLAWSNPTRITSLDASRASAAFAGSGLTTHYLKGTNFGFSIPTGATITGIKLEIAKHNSADYPGVVDSTVKLVKGGSVVGSNRAAAGAWTTTRDTIYTYGGETDKWGTTWTPAEINSSDFGAVLSAYKADSWGNANVDYFRITVYFALNITLTISEATHSHSADNAVLVENKTLVASECSHAHSVENVALTENKTLAVAEASHAHGVDGDLVLVEESGEVELVVADSSHSQAADSFNLTQAHILTVTECAHTQTADNAILSQVHNLLPQSSDHAHSADAPALTQNQTLILNNSFHSHLADAINLFVIHNLLINQCNHNHNVDGVDLIEEKVLAVNAGLHSHLVDGIELFQIYRIKIRKGWHLHFADEIRLVCINDWGTPRLALDDDGDWFWRKGQK